MTVMKAASFIQALFMSLALTAALPLAGCHGGRNEVAAVPQAAPTAKVLDEPTKELPSDLFKGTMPIYPGAQVQHIRKVKGAMREILFELKNAPSLNQMVSFYKEGLKKGDFKITSSLIMPARKTWSCDFHKDGRPGSVMLYPEDNDKTSTTIDLIYETASSIDPNLLEPIEEFDVIGPGPPAEVAPVAQNDSQDKAKLNEKAKRN